MKRKLTKLLNEVSEAEIELDRLENLTEFAAWRTDIENFADVYAKFVIDRDIDMCVPKNALLLNSKTSLTKGRKRKNNDVINTKVNMKKSK